MKPWQLFLQETQNTKIAIFEVDMPENIPVWLNHSPGVWKYKYKNYRRNTQLGFQIGNFCYGNFKYNGIADTGINDVIIRINSFIVNGENYAVTSSLSNCKNNNYSFYYDAAKQTLYVNFFDKIPTIGNVKAGITRGFATQSIYLDDIYYEPRVKSIPNVSLKIDDSFFGRNKYSSGTVILYNEDGYFDNYFDDTIFGQECRIKLSGKLNDGTQLEYIDTKTLYTGYVQQIKMTPNDVVFTLGDKKDKIGRTLPVNFFSSTDYPNIKSGDDGKGIPLVWGERKNIPCVCVNEDETGPPANYQFVIADITNHSIKALNNVYIDGIEETPTPTLVNDTVNDIAYFNIASGGNYEPGNKVSANVSGFDDSTLRDGSGDLIEDALDQIEDIFDNYLNIPYNEDNFDQEQWETEKANDYDQSILVRDNTKISEILKTTALGHLGNFIFKGNNKWTFRTINDSDRIQLLIELDEIFNVPNKFDDGKKYLTSATVSYDKDDERDRYTEYTDNSEQQNIYNTYNVYKTRNFETYLVNAADAQSLAGDIITEFKDIKSEFVVLTSIRAADIEIYDIITVVLNRKQSTWLGPVKCRVNGITYRLNNPMKIELSLRYVADDSATAVIDMLKIVKEQDYILQINKSSDGDDMLNIVKWR